MAAENGSTSLPARIVVALIGVLLSSGLGWLALEVVYVRNGLDVVESEKLRNEKEIAKLHDAVTCIQSGTCGDRYLNSWATRDFKLVNQRLEWLEKHCQLKE